MKRTRRFIALLLATILMLFTLAPSALAAYKVQAVKLNQWYTLRDSSPNMTIYRLKVTGETVVYFNWKNYDTESNWGGIFLYYDKACSSSVDLVSFSDSSSGKDALVLYSGTYYIKMYDYNERTKVKITTKPATKLNQSSFCMANASSLKAGKKAEFAQTRKFNYSRWFKIKLTKAQVITFYGRLGYYTLFDKNSNEISCERRSDQYITSGSQAKGTYYLKIESNYSGGLKKQVNTTPSI